MALGLRATPGPVTRLQSHSTRQQQPRRSSCVVPGLGGCWNRVNTVLLLDNESQHLQVRYPSKDEGRRSERHVVDKVACVSSRYGDTRRVASPNRHDDARYQTDQSLDNNQSPPRLE